jgi:hypothetical protein
VGQEQGILASSSTLLVMISPLALMRVRNNLVATPMELRISFSLHVLQV